MSHTGRVLPSGSINLADERLGARVLFATDEFFAPKERLLQAVEPQWRPGVYDAHGKWMDGWETRRRRDAGHDHCVVQLAGAGRLSLLEIDTRYFTGNYPPFVSVQACRTALAPDESTSWVQIVPRSALQGDHRNYLEVPSTDICTHLKLNLYPDGGVARLRAYGQLQVELTAAAEPVDLAAALNGGLAIACSDEHYGSMHNLLLPGRATSMADGWETRRRREPGYDWVIVRLGHPGHLESVEIDTAFYRGNYPHQVSIHAARLPADAEVSSAEALWWPVLLEPQALQADRIHTFTRELCPHGPVSHVRVNIHPDGGLSRVRLLGRPVR